MQKYLFVNILQNLPTASWKKVVLPIEWQAELNKKEQDTQFEANTRYYIT